MWLSFFILSILSVLLFGILAKVLNLLMRDNGKKISLFHMLFAGAFMAAFFMFMPIHLSADEAGIANSILLSILNSMQIFALGSDFSIVRNSMPFCVS